MNSVDTYFVYIVKCADDSLYTGIAKNVGERIEKHNAGRGAKYTKARLPVTLVYAEKVPNRSAASKREHKIKQLRKKEKIKLISTNPLS